ncbi:hypothetical protein NESM_000243200 [Novymonas esmeraldas]|uniref:Uncharacterized protein n=1 Tax=Novymonas esmeraldas TaxID=1808958 RepID=A0AAW0F8C8_9TRYP
MLQRLSWLSGPPSSRPSVLAGGAAPSELALSRRRDRLQQSGAIVSSRSVASRAEANLDVDVVDVGEGRRATEVEHLLARLEQHGLRRRRVGEDDAAAYAVDIAVRVAETVDDSSDEDGPGTDHVEGSDASCAPHTDATSSSAAPSSQLSDTREPHYYLCVPCELRLTRISSRPPRWRELEDVHFHFSSASHRAAASWMADDDVDATLHSTPLITPVQHYSRIYVNGVPTLLSRRPGGGDMFYPLPHEQDLVAASTASAPRDCGASSQVIAASRDPAAALFPPSGRCGALGGAPALWHRAFSSICTGNVQVVRRSRACGQPETPQQQHKYRLAQRKLRSLVTVDHITLEEYRTHSWTPPEQMPLSPALYRLRRERIPKALLVPVKSPKHAGCSACQSPDVDAPHRVVYTQPHITMAQAGRDDDKQDGASGGAPAPMTVFEDECYRVALLSAAERTLEAAQRHGGAAGVPGHHLDDPRDALSQDASQPTLTLELLLQHTQSTPQPWQPAPGSATAANSSVAPTSAPPSPSRRSSRPRSHRGDGRSASVTKPPPSSSSSSSAVPPRKRMKG